MSQFLRHEITKSLLILVVILVIAMAIAYPLKLMTGQEFGDPLEAIAWCTAGACTGEIISIVRRRIRR
jgi:uncharacterized protein (UPF0333 family)